MILFTRNKSVMVCESFKTNKKEQNLTPTVTASPELVSNLPAITTVLPSVLTPIKTTQGPPKLPILVMSSVLPTVNPLEIPPSLSTDPHVVIQVSSLTSSLQTLVKSKSLKKAQKQFRLKMKKKQKNKSLVSSNCHATLQEPLKLTNHNSLMQQLLPKKPQQEVTLLKRNTEKKHKSKHVLLHQCHITMPVSVPVISPRVQMQPFVTKKNQQLFKRKMKKNRKNTVFHFRSKRMNYGLLLLVVFFLMNTNAMQENQIKTENPEKIDYEENELSFYSINELSFYNTNGELGVQMITEERKKSILSSLKKHPMVSFMILIFLLMELMCAIFMNTGPLIWHLSGVEILIFTVIYAVFTGDEDMIDTDVKQNIDTTFPKAFETLVSAYYTLRSRFVIVWNTVGITFLTIGTYLCYSFPVELYRWWIFIPEFSGIGFLWLLTIFPLKLPFAHKPCCLEYLEWHETFAILSFVSFFVFQICHSFVYVIVLTTYTAPLLSHITSVIICISLFILSFFNLYHLNKAYSRPKNTNSDVGNKKNQFSDVASEWYGAVGTLLYFVLSDLLSMYIKSTFNLPYAGEGD